MINTMPQSDYSVRSNLYVRLQAFGFACVVFVVSLVLFSFYQGGDQEHYRKFYDGVADFHFVDAFEFYTSTLGSKEPGYFLLVYFFSPFINKDLLFSLVNFLFAYFVFLWMLVCGVRSYIVALVLFNFYFLVLLLSAERLKVSLLIFFIGYYGPVFWRYFFYMLSVLIHVQFLILFVSIQSKRISRVVVRLSNGWVGYDFFLLLMLVFLFWIIFVFFLSEHVIAKFNYYRDLWGGVGAVVKPAIFAGCACFYARRKWLEALFATLPMVFAAYFVGAERTAFLAYFVSMYFALQHRGGANFFVIISSVYFAVKGFYFVLNILTFGDGFHGVSVVQ